MKLAKREWVCLCSKLHPEKATHEDIEPFVRGLRVFTGSVAPLQLHTFENQDWNLAEAF